MQCSSTSVIRACCSALCACAGSGGSEWLHCALPWPLRMLCGRLLDKEGRGKVLWGNAWLIVPAPGRPLKGAIEGARQGDRILIRAGVYTDHLNIGAGVEASLAQSCGSR